MRRQLLTLLLAVSLMTACAPKVVLLTDAPEATATERPDPGPSATSKPTAIPGSKLGVGPDALKGTTLSVWHGLDGESGALFNQMAAEFSLTNSWGIKVEATPQKNMAQLAQAVDAALQGPEHPDLVLALPEHAQGWDAQGAVIDLAPYLANSEFGLSLSETQDIPAIFLQQDLLDGKQLGVPALRTARVLFYNVSFAKELGFNTPPQSADDFKKQACAANASWKTDKDQTNDGYGGWVLDNAMVDPAAPWTAYAWLRASGGDIYADGKYTFATSDNQAALDFLGTLRSDSCAWLSTAQSNAEALAGRKALFAAGSLDELNEFRNAFAGSPDQWTLIAFPGKSPAIVAYGPDYIILKSSQARQLAAWLFVRWMLSPENQARWVRQAGLFPMRISAIDLLANLRSANPQWAAAVDLLPQARIYPQAASWPKARLVLGDGFFNLFQFDVSPDKIKATLEEMDNTLADLLAK